MRVPDLFENAREDGAGFSAESEQVELLRGEGERLAVHRDLMGPAINRERANGAGARSSGRASFETSPHECGRAALAAERLPM
jgi:hypothetical protein